MIFIGIIVSWFAIATCWLLVVKFRTDSRIGRKWYDFGDFQLPVVALAILCLSIGTVALLHPTPQFSTNDQQVEYGLRTRQPWLVTDAIGSKIKYDSLNENLHYQLLQTHFLQQDERPPHPHAWEQKGVQFFNLYSNWALQTDDKRKADIGNLFLAWWYILCEPFDHTNAQFHLRQIDNDNLPYFNLAIGKMMQDGLGEVAAIPYYQQEITLKGARSEATAALAVCHSRMNDFDALRKLVYDSTTQNWIDSELRYEVYYRDGNFIRFYLLHFQQFGTTLSLWGLTGGLLILIVWLIFLKRLSYLTSLSWFGLIFTAFVGALLAMGTWWLYAFSKYDLKMGLNGEPLNDMLFCVFGIGGIEEFVKVLAFLLVLRFTAFVQRPADYMIVASATGLGFTFFENLLYVSKYGLDVLHARAITASVAHMVSGSLVAYGFVLARRYRPVRWWIVPLFFIAAMLAHGFYDFWLVNDRLPAMRLITLLFFLVLILIYAICLNNALNQTATVLSPVVNTQRLAAFLVGALILVFTLEYISVSVVYGYVMGYRTALNSFLSGGYLIFFLSVHLSNIVVVPGAWYPFQILNSFFPVIQGMQMRYDTLPFKRGEQFTFRVENGAVYTGTVERYTSRHAENDTVQLSLMNTSFPSNGIGYGEVWLDLSEKESDWKGLLLLDLVNTHEPSFRFVTTAYIEHKATEAEP
jgi:RsiW-degrading membrane proteinase PrsW (M82 family)